MDVLKVLQDLSNALGAPGFETEVRQVIQSHLGSITENWQVDPLGNLMVTLGDGEDFTVMIDAHLDEVALMVSHIDEGGFLRITNLGGWDVRILPSHSVIVQTRENKKISGVIGSVPPHILTVQDKSKVIPLSDLFVDVGATSRREAKSWGIHIGDPAVISYPFEKLNSSFVRGKAFDDRMGCALALALLDSLKDEKLPYKLVVNFSVCEEVGLRGATTAAFQIQPDLCLVLEGTVGADVPGVALHKRPTTLAKGPAITVADRRTIVPRELIALLEDLAKEHKIPYQLKIPGSGGTNAGAIHTSRKGVPTAIVSVACRYIHSPFSMAHTGDIRHTFDLARAFLLEGVDRIRETWEGQKVQQ